MRTRKIITICLVFACASLALLGYFSHRNRPEFVDNGEECRWSRDSRMLYYIVRRENCRLHRYDTLTGEKREYNVYLPEYYDISPDQKMAVTRKSFVRGGVSVYDYIEVVDIATGKRRKIFSSRESLNRPIFWLVSNRIVFTEPVKIRGKHCRYFARISAINPDGTDKTEVIRDAIIMVPAHDGSGFIYESAQQPFHYYFYNFTTKTSKEIRPKSGTKYSGITPYYVSSRQIIYDEYRSSDEMKVLNLATMQTRRFELPVSPAYCAFISPDLTKYWNFTIWIDSTDRGTLHVVRMPKELTRKLRHH